MTEKRLLRLHRWFKSCLPRSNVTKQLFTAAGLGRQPFSTLQAGTEEIITSLIASGANLHAIFGPNWMTPLHFAARARDPEATRTLLTLGAHVNTQDRNGNTALHYLLMFSETNLGRTKETLLSLVEKNASLTLRNQKGEQALHIATSMGRLEAAKLLVAKGAPLSSQNNKGGSPLDLAAVAGRLRLVRFFLSKGAIVSTQLLDRVKDHKLCNMYTLLEQTTSLELLRDPYEEFFDVLGELLPYVPFASAKQDHSLHLETLLFEVASELGEQEGNIQSEFGHLDNYLNAGPHEDDTDILTQAAEEFADDLWHHPYRAQILFLIKSWPEIEDVEVKEQLKVFKKPFCEAFVRSILF